MGIPVGVEKPSGRTDDEGNQEEDANYRRHVRFFIRISIFCTSNLSLIIMHRVIFVSIALPMSARLADESISQMFVVVVVVLKK